MTNFLSGLSMEFISLELIWEEGDILATLQREALSHKQEFSKVQ